MDKVTVWINNTDRRYSTTEPTMNLVFKDGVLHQEHKVTNYLNGKPESGYFEWRPVGEIK